ncbi:MAG TPA: asparagine synthase (glutamine-hydrolyzing) [Candidatus Cybelea sp.]|nr:asparagine synthase (glutamine-hydrolyzing) [Candidatus Cybelea sp.]
MCGITGIADLSSPVRAEILQRMTRTLRHRGPDEESFHLPTPAPEGAAIGFGFRRLAIIDLTGGRQPMGNEDDSIWIVCNGEIYNHGDLRAELEAKGHSFRTHCDIEVLLHLYEQRGTECLTKVNGMFALAIWDGKNQTLFLARDRVGKKPLYYRHTPTQLIFGSEVKALLAHPDCPRELDARNLSKYLAYEYVPSPHCIFKGINKLPAGHWLTWKNGETRVSRYWDLKFAGGSDHRSEDEIAEELRERLKEAVRLRLISDVPLGVFLSGGIDSSSVVAMMAELMPPDRIKTFAIGFEEKSFDESGHARRVANFFGTDHREQILQGKAMLDILPEVAAFLDEPLADASIIPTYLLSKFTRQHVTVALGGDGGDELFAGYPTFQAHRMAAFYKIPRVLHEHMIQPLAECLPVSSENFSIDFKVKRFLRGMGLRPEIRDQFWVGSFTPDEQRALLQGSSPEIDAYEDIVEAEKNCGSKNSMERLIYLYCKFYLQDDILTKVDRASMACSLEARAPFLDYTFVEFANAIPFHFKLKGLTAKYILKKAMRKKLPPEILGRGKKGFGIPVAKWFREDLREPLLDLLSESRIRRQGIFNPAEITRLVDEHLHGKKDNRKQLWTLFLFELWAEHYYVSPPRNDAVTVKV